MPTEIFKSYLCPDDSRYHDAPIPDKLNYAKTASEDEWIEPAHIVLDGVGSIPFFIEDYDNGRKGAVVVVHTSRAFGETYFSSLSPDQVEYWLGQPNSRTAIPMRQLKLYEIAGKLVVNETGDISKVIVRGILPIDVYTENTVARFPHSPAPKMDFSN